MAVGLAAMPATTQSALQVDVIKQYGGLVTIQRRVKVKVPGKHFPQLQPAEQKVEYEGEAIEFVERHVFPKHVKAWGAAHTGPGIRFIGSPPSLLLGHFCSAHPCTQHHGYASHAAP